CDQAEAPDIPCAGPGCRFLRVTPGVAGLIAKLDAATHLVRGTLSEAKKLAYLDTLVNAGDEKAIGTIRFQQFKAAVDTSGTAGQDDNGVSLSFGSLGLAGQIAGKIDKAGQQSSQSQERQQPENTTKGGTASRHLGHPGQGAKHGDARGDETDNAGDDGQKRQQEEQPRADREGGQEGERSRRQRPVEEANAEGRGCQPEEAAQEALAKRMQLKASRNLGITRAHQVQKLDHRTVDRQSAARDEDDCHDGRGPDKEKQEDREGSQAPRQIEEAADPLLMIVKPGGGKGLGQSCTCLR